MATYTRILVPVKGNSTDKEAVALACSIAKRDKGQVFIIYVIEVKRALPLDAESDEAVLRGDEALEAAEQVASKAGLSVTAELLQAREVGPAIVDEAVQRKADLIILGTPYKKKFGEFDTGKTIPYVLRYSQCQVWVMREAVTPEVITK